MPPLPASSLPSFRWFQQVSISTTPAAATSSTVTSNASPFPGGVHPEGGDDLLDALLGLDVSSGGETFKPGATAPPGAAGAFGGGVDIASRDRFGFDDPTQLFSEVVAAGRAAGGGQQRGRAALQRTPWGGGDGAEGGGDSMLDALLGLEVGISSTTTVPAEQDLLGSGVGVGGEFRADDAGPESDEEVVDGSPGRRNVGDGEGVSPPFEGADLGRLCTHLNDRNRKAKRLAQRCQEMFLRLFFKVGALCVTAPF